MSNETYGPDSVNPEEFMPNNNQVGPKITGNIPPEVAARLQGKKNQNFSQQEPQLRVTGSSKLEELLSNIQNITNNYEKITLPSLGKFYNGEDGPTDGILHVRPMTGKEESILATPRFVKKGDAISMIFKNCIKENYQPENFLSVDRTYLLIWLRGVSYGNNYQVELTCPFTNKKFNENIDLNLDVDLCPDDFDESSLSGVLPTTGYNFTYRLSRGKDETSLQTRREKDAKFDKKPNETDDTLIIRTAQLVESIEGLTDKTELEVLIKNLPVSDGNHLRNLVNDPPFGVQTKLTVISPFAADEFEVELPIDSSFFFPRRQKTK